jgi:hypothetical protein
MFHQICRKFDVLWGQTGVNQGGSVLRNPHDRRCTSTYDARLVDDDDQKIT